MENETQAQTGKIEIMRNSLTGEIEDPIFDRKKIELELAISFKNETSFGTPEDVISCATGFYEWLTSY